MKLEYLIEILLALGLGNSIVRIIENIFLYYQSKKRGILFSDMLLQFKHPKLWAFLFKNRGIKKFINSRFRKVFVFVIWGILLLVFLMLTFLWGYFLKTSDYAQLFRYKY